MLRTQNKIKFLLQHSKSLKIVFFMVCGVFFTSVNASLPYTSDQTDKPKSGSSYFLDIDNLQPSYDSDGSITHYTEKEDPSAAWIFIPIKSSMRDYYKTVASVVAADLHKKIDEHSLVPHTKFLIGKDTDGYQLRGSVYKKNSSTIPIMEIMKKGDFDDYANNTIYKDYNVERNVGVWNCLGLPVSPDPTLLELSEDGKLVRYDYYNSFQYNNSKIYEKCFCTSDFPISNYKCNIEYIEKLKQELRVKSKKTIEKVISEIRKNSREHLGERDLTKVNQALDQIINTVVKSKMRLKLLSVFLVLMLLHTYGNAAIIERFSIQVENGKETYMEGGKNVGYVIKTVSGKPHVKIASYKGKTYFIKLAHIGEPLELRGKIGSIIASRILNDIFKDKEKRYPLLSLAFNPDSLNSNVEPFRVLSPKLEDFTSIADIVSKQPDKKTKIGVDDLENLYIGMYLIGGGDPHMHNVFYNLQNHHLGSVDLDVSFKEHKSYYIQQKTKRVIIPRLL